MNCKFKFLSVFLSAGILLNSTSMAFAAQDNIGVVSGNQLSDNSNPEKPKKARSSFWQYIKSYFCDEETEDEQSTQAQPKEESKQSEKTQEAPAYKQMKVVVTIGHDLYDFPGTPAVRGKYSDKRSERYEEKVAVATIKALRRLGVDVTVAFDLQGSKALSEATGKAPLLSEVKTTAEVYNTAKYQELSNMANPDVFISICSNASEGDYLRGVQVFPASQYEASQKLINQRQSGIDRIIRESNGEIKPEIRIMNYKYGKESQFIGACIYAALTGEAGKDVVEYTIAINDFNKDETETLHSLASGNCFDGRGNIGLNKAIEQPPYNDAQTIYVSTPGVTVCPAYLSNSHDAEQLWEKADVAGDLIAKAIVVAVNTLHFHK